jgi:hypothetical protein
VRRSTTNCFSLSTVFFTLTISLIKNVSRETLLQSNPYVSRETLAMIADRYTLYMDRADYLCTRTD